MLTLAKSAALPLCGLIGKPIAVSDQEETMDK